MKKILTLIMVVVVCQFGYSQLTVSCPPCLPVSGCNQCFATQSEADACSSRRLIQEALVATDGIENTNDGFKVLSNPVRDGLLRISNGDQVEGTIYIYNQLGSVVEKIILDGSINVSHTMNLTQGIYHLVAIGNNGAAIDRKKLLVQD